ncbi:MAG: M2 family metallopeptidase, partial [Parvularculaceae bacterium]
MISNISRRALGAFGAVSLIALTAACGVQPAEPQPAPDPAPEANAESAAEFAEKVEATYRDAFEEASRIQWVNATYINFDTDWLAAKNTAELTKMAVDFANDAARFDNVALSPDVRRKLDFMKLGITLPAPTRAGAADELAQLTTRLGSAYSTGAINVDPATFRTQIAEIRGPSGDLEDGAIRQNETELLMRQMRDPAKLAEVWTKWNDYAAAMKGDYVRMVEIANEGAKELGYADVGALWRSGYDMSPDEFETETDRLWGQVKPLYDQLHCYVRAELNEKYGDEVVPLDKPIRADLLGNMWAQEWGAISDIVSVGDSAAPIDLDKILVEKGYDPVKMVATGENFFTSLGFDPLPDTFWERSQITKPRDREV